MTLFNIKDTAKRLLNLKEIVFDLMRTNSVMVLIIIAVVFIFITFFCLSNGIGLSHHLVLESSLFLFGFIILFLVLAAGARRISHICVETKMGLVGAKLHTRLITLFGIIAVAPTLIVGTLAALFFHYGIEVWFSDRIHTALREARFVAAGYLQEHNDNARTEAFALANTLLTIQNDLFSHGEDLLHHSNKLHALLEDEVMERGLLDAMVFDSLTKKIIASGGILINRDTSSLEEIPSSMIAMAQTGEVAILYKPDDKVVRSVVSLGGNNGLMLVITQAVDPTILYHMQRTNKVVSDYQRLIHNRYNIQFILAGIFVVMSLLVLGLAILIGLTFANHIVRPISSLIIAAKRISYGDLTIRVPVYGNYKNDDEVTALSQAFNIMADRLERQRSALIEAYKQIDERRIFIEIVLEGVSAGVIGLDKNERIEISNLAASTILQYNLEDAVGKSLIEMVPEFSILLDKIKKMPYQEHTAEITIKAENIFLSQYHKNDRQKNVLGRTLFVRIASEMRAASSLKGDNNGYIITFDDITELQHAQRTAAWADVARRIAHEIKNPLTPIQLAAERLNRRFKKEIKNSPELYTQLIETIIRQVGDIRRMVDEFSAFARMPCPVMKLYDLTEICRQAVFLEKHAHPNIDYIFNGDKECFNQTHKNNVIKALCDRRLLSQALTNLLQNAADSIDIRLNKKKNISKEKINDNERGCIILSLEIDNNQIMIAVEDNGIGLPTEDFHRLAEPYVTHKARGTGLGLAIVHKIMEAHNGHLKMRNIATNSLEEERKKIKTHHKSHIRFITGACIMLCFPLKKEKNILDLSEGS